MEIKTCLVIILSFVLFGCNPDQNKNSQLIKKYVSKEKKIEEKDVKKKNNDLDQLKWHSAGLHYKKKFFCSASILAEDWIVTAGHCLNYLKREKIKYLEVTFGLNQNQPDFSIPVARIVRPDVYKEKSDGRQPFWDITLVQLQSSIPAGYKPIEVVPIPLSDLEQLSGYLLGFGVTQYGADDAGNVKLSKGTIERYFDKGYLEGLLKIDFEKNGPCSGDSGGGFYINKNGKWYLVASVSGMHSPINKDMDDLIVGSRSGQADICVLNQATFSPLSYYADWIKKYIREIPLVMSEKNDFSHRRYTTISNWCFQQDLTDSEKYIMLDQVMAYGEGICEGPSLPIANSQLDIEGVFLNDGSFIRDLTHLEFMHFRNSNVDKFPDLFDLTGLKSVVVKNSVLTSLGGFAVAPALESISIIESPIETEQLKSLLSSNSIKNLQIRRMNSFFPPLDMENLSLENLSLIESNLKSVEGIEMLTQLTRLNLSHNQLTTVAGLDFLAKLTHLNLSHNRITNISSLAKLKNLKVLKIRNNPIDVTTCPREESQWWKEFCASL